MRTLKVTLKQHTPLIHFQHDQYGATLRASEVKPKLDQYLVRKVLGNNFSACKPFLLGKEESLEGYFNNGRCALNYKMSIIPYDRKDVTLSITGPDDEGKYSTERFPMLLSNMGGKEDGSELMNLVLYNHVELQFTIWNSDLYDLIRRELPRFFAITNFGQRETKGFGSFTVYRFDNEEPIKWNEAQYYERGCPMMLFKVSGRNEMDKQKKIFDVCDFYWKCLKAGINYTRGNPSSKFYIKSFLYHYLNSKRGLTWEKRSVKQRFGLGRRRGPVIPNPNTPIFARAILGCPDKYADNRKEVKVEHLITNRANEKQKIARIPSPIYLKPVCFGGFVYVYILFNSEITTRLRGLTEKKFHMTDGHTTLDMDIEVFLNETNYKEFISDYHEYLSTNSDVLGALYCNDSIGDYVDCSSQSLEDVYGFVPRDFDWKNILGGNQAVGLNEV